VHATLTDKRDRKVEPVRQGIRRTWPNNRSHGTRTEIAEQLVFHESSNPCARQMTTISSGDQFYQATAGAKDIKGASAHLRCGSKVSYLGEAARRIPVGEAVFGQLLWLDTGLAHLDDGFSCEARRP
jgi:hypothetical protein